MSKQLKKVFVPATLAAVVGGTLYDMDSFYVHADGMTTVVDGGRDLVEKDVHVNGSAQTIYVNYRYNRPDGEHWSTGTANVIGNKTLVTAAHLFLDWNYDKLSAITGVDFYIGANGAAVTNGVPSGDYKKITMTGDEFRKAVHFYNKDGFLKPREKITQLIDGQPDTTYSMASNAYDLAAISLPDVFAFKSKEAGLGLSDPMRLTSSYELPKKGDTISYVGYPGTGKGMEKQLANGLFKQGRQYGTNGPAVSILTKDLGGDTHAFNSDGLYDPESSSSLGRLADKDAKNHLHDFGNLDAPLLQIKMTSIPGVSGSALKNSKGEVISVISGMTTRPSTYGTLFDNKRLDWLRSIIKADNVTGLQTDKDGSRYVFDDNGFLVRNGKKRIGDYEFTTNADGKVVAERNAKADEDKAKADAEKAAKEKAEKEKAEKEKADKEKADKEKAEKEKAEAEANKKTYAYAINVTVIDDATGQKAFEHANPMATDSSKEAYEKALAKILDPIKDRLGGGSQKGVPFYALFDDVYTNKATSEASKGPFTFVNYKLNENTRVEGNKTMQRATVEVHVTSKVAKPVETKPVETKPVETKPVETKPVETKLVETKPAKVHYQLDITVIDDATGKTIKTKTVMGDSETENRYQSILTAQKNGFDVYLTNGKYEGLPVSIGENADGLTYSYQSGTYQPVSSKLSEGTRTENNVMTRTGKLELHVTSQLPQDEVINVVSKDGHMLKTLTKQDLGGRSVADVIGAIRDGKGNDILPNVTLSANAKPVNVVSNGKTVKTWTVVVESGVVVPVESTKPVETKPVETKPVETKPVETKPVETKPVETKPVETKPVESKPVETKPVETKPVETKPVETKPVETKPVETKPVEPTKPVVPADRPGNEPAPKVTNYDVTVSVIDDATGKVLSKKVLDGTGDDAYKKTLSDVSSTISAYLKNGRYEGLSVTPKDNALGFDTVEKASDKVYEPVSSNTSEGTRLTGTITTKSATVEFHVISQLPYQDDVIDVVTDKGKLLDTLKASDLNGDSVASVVRSGREGKHLMHGRFKNVPVSRVDNPVYVTTDGKTVKKWTVVVPTSFVAGDAPNRPSDTDKPIVPDKPVETKPVETKPVETKPVETKPVETKPVETKPVETKPVETKPVETKPVETKPVETKPVETKPVETKPVEIKPVETKPVETEPVETKPVETKPVETKPVETKPVETKPVEIKPVETKPVETKPVETKPVETKPVETKPNDSFEAERQAQKAHLAEEARLAAVAAGLIKEGETFNKEQAAYAESIRQNAQAEYARLSAEKEKEDAEKQLAKVAADNKRQWFKKEADTILSQLDDVLKALDRQSDDIAKTLKERFGVSTPSVNKVVKLDDVTKVNSVSKVDDVTKVDTATKVDDVTKVDTVTPKGNGVVTKVATVTPEGDNVTKVDKVTSKGNDVAKVDKVIPKVDKVISEVDKITPKDDSVTKVDTITSKVDSVTSKGNTITPKGNTITPKSNNVTSKSDTVTKVDVVTSNDNTVTPKGNSVTKDNGITSDGAAKRGNTIKNDSKTTKPTTNAELPDAGDSLVARLSALPVIGLGFGLLLRRRNREE